MSKPISLLTELVSLADGDLIEVVDVSETNLNDKNKKVTLLTLKAFLAIVNSGNFSDWNIATTYTGGTTYYVAYNNNIWKFIKLTDDTGTTPGTDDTIWQLTSTGAFAHEKNKDQYLDQGGANEVSAAKLRTAFEFDADGYITAQNWVSESGDYKFRITRNNDGLEQINPI
jgi:hypothetical protein